MDDYDSTAPRWKPLMYTRVSDNLSISTASWATSGSHFWPTYESLMRYTKRGKPTQKMIYHKGLREAFYAHLAIVKEMKKLIKQQQGE